MSLFYWLTSLEELETFFEIRGSDNFKLSFKGYGSIGNLAFLLESI